jgi:hypothetical protein
MSEWFLNKCALCRDPVNFDADPNAIHALNPETRRMADMHLRCAIQAEEELTPEEKEKLELYILNH